MRRLESHFSDSSGANLSVDKADTSAPSWVPMGSPGPVQTEAPTLVSCGADICADWRANLSAVMGAD